MERMTAGDPAASKWIAVESLLATGVTLYLALRLDRPSVWAVVPVVLLALPGRRPEDYGLDARLTPPPLRGHLLLGAAALLGYTAAHFLVVRWLTGASFSPRLPPEPGWLLVQQLVVVAFPEELFFRGYLQSNLNRIFARPFRLFGARFGPALPLQAATFALCHVVGGDWTRLRVFFFGLLAGWLRERNGAIAAPVVYHAAANFWYALLAASLR
ncbi:MAG: myxosortase family intramembrane protease [Candidatus Binatia bacterium]